MTDCYYRRVEPDGDEQVFDSTDLTCSNWDPSIQHGSPPLALLTKAIEDLPAGSGQRIGRLTLDILGPIPVDRVRVRAWGKSPGSADLAVRRPNERRRIRRHRPSGGTPDGMAAGHQRHI